MASFCSVVSPIRPSRWLPFCDFFISQVTARSICLAYLPSLGVLPSMSRAMPASAVMATGYWPPLAAQWPSFLSSETICFSTSHFSPSLMVWRYFLGISSARARGAGPTVSAARAVRDATTTVKRNMR